MANTIDSELQLNTVLESALTGFKKKIIALKGFSTVFKSVVLEGTNKVLVPYYPLETAASTDFNGTYTFGNTDTQGKEVTINKRKYQSLKRTSDEYNRQPAFDPEKFGQMKGEKLAEDVFADILSVVTNAKYGAAAVIQPALGFDIADIIKLREACNAAEWPKVGRSLILDSAYDAALLGDNNVRFATNLGDNSAIREGEVGRILGFDYFNTELIPDNGENLVGMAIYSSAILVAFSPIEPEPSVMDRLTAYEMVTDPETGLTLEYRQWGDPETDSGKYVIECNYGYGVGETAAIKRITSA